jgi:exopolysaccharide production protein ExoQ
MGAPLAFLICSIGIAGLFFLDRDRSTRNSKAIWLPVLWLWIVGSRPLSSWLGIGWGNSQNALDATLDGNPLDAFVFAVLLIAGFVVLLKRGPKTRAFLKASGPILIYFLYCLISVAWSPYPEAAFKRWTKDLGDLVMVLVIVTDPHPVVALRRIFSRVGFVLLPLSVVLIRYTYLGHSYDASFQLMNTGVTTNKNTLGLVTFVISLGALWNVRALLIDKDQPNRRRRLVAQCSLLAFGIALLQMAHSATSVACFILGAGIILATSLRAMRGRPARVHALCASIVLAGGFMMLSGGESGVIHALGRQTDLTGRTDIWSAVLLSVANPLIGSGFESFWNSSVGTVLRHLPPGYAYMTSLNSSHNGYIEVYANLGWVGLCLVGLILVAGYLRACRAFQREPELSSLLLAYIAVSVIYNITESGFRVLTPSWIFLLLAVVSASGIVLGAFSREAAEHIPEPVGIRDFASGRPRKVLAPTR